MRREGTDGQLGSLLMGGSYPRKNGSSRGVGVILETRELCLGSVPDLEALCILADKVLEVRRHGATVNFGPSTGFSHALGYVEDDTREAILVDPDFLVVGDLAQLAVRGRRVCQRERMCS